MNRLIAAAAAAAGLFAAVVAGGAHAAAANGYYVAVPVAAPEKASTMLTRDTVWTRQGDAFVANKAPQREEVLCALVAQRAGQLASFSAGGKPFDADAMAKCNAKAK